MQLPLALVLVLLQSAASRMEQQQQFAAWVHYAEAGESSWHKRWICFNQSSLQIFKSDKPGTKPLFSHSLSSLVAKKLASSFERRYSAIVFTLLRNFIVSFASQADLDAAVSLITRIQESVSGCLSLCQLLPACPPPLSSPRIRCGPVCASCWGRSSCRRGQHLRERNVWSLNPTRIRYLSRQASCKGARQSLQAVFAGGRWCAAHLLIICAFI